MTTATDTTVEAEATAAAAVADFIAKTAEAHAQVFQTSFVPLIQNMSGIKLDGQVVATGHLVDGAIVIDMRFDYTNKYADAWETAQRIIFNAFFEEGLKRYSAMTK